MEALHIEDIAAVEYAEKEFDLDLEFPDVSQLVSRIDPFKEIDKQYMFLVQSKMPGAWASFRTSMARTWHPSYRHLTLEQVTESYVAEIDTLIDQAQDLEKQVSVVTEELFERLQIVKSYELGFINNVQATMAQCEQLDTHIDALTATLEQDLVPEERIQYEIMLEQAHTKREEADQNNYRDSAMWKRCYLFCEDIKFFTRMLRNTRSASQQIVVGAKLQRDRLQLGNIVDSLLENMVRTTHTIVGQMQFIRDVYTLRYSYLAQDIYDARDYIRNHAELATGKRQDTKQLQKAGDLLGKETTRTRNQIMEELKKKYNIEKQPSGIYAVKTPN